MWQYITLTRRIYLIDCPGIVPSSAASDSTTATVLKGVVRVEALPTPSEHIPALLQRVRPIYLSRTYNTPLPELKDGQDTPCWDADEFLDKLARQKGRLLKGGEPDLEGVAKIVLNDWVRGRIPYFVEPPHKPSNAIAVEPEPDDKDSSKLTVAQKLRGIIQKNTFVSEDIQQVEEEEEEATDEEFTGFGDNGGEADGNHENDSDEGTELQWGDVFPEDSVTKTPPKEVRPANRKTVLICNGSVH